MIEKNCVWCGAEIVKAPGMTMHQLYCGKNCARLAANAQKRDRLRAIRAAEAAKKRAAREQSLDTCIKAADRLGISYGQYMASRREDL